MKMARQFVLYAALIVVFGGLIFYLLHAGKSFDHPVSRFVESAKTKPDGGGFFSGLYKVNLQETLPRLLLQIIIIIIVTQLLGGLFKKIGWIFRWDHMNRYNLYIYIYSTGCRRIWCMKVYPMYDHNNNNNNNRWDPFFDGI